MAEAEYKDVRVEETLRVKIGEAKDLPATSFSSSSRNTCCAIKIDSEEIFRTSIVEKSLNPFFGADFKGEIPKKFRLLSFYVYEVGNKNKVLGKVSLKKEELYKYHQKEHWFPLTYQDGDTEVQGKVQVEIRLDECLNSSDSSHRVAVKVLECSDLPVINGSCNPYAVVTLSSGKTKSKDIRKTVVKKKTICPQFEETFFFPIEKSQGVERSSSYIVDDVVSLEVSVSLFHDDSKVSREMLGHMFKGCFLGEVKIPIVFNDLNRPHKAWYCLQAKEHSRSNELSLGSIRLRISYSEDYVFPSKYYDGLRNLILQSANTKPITSSAAFILGEIVNRESAAQPLVRLFLNHGKLIPLVHALANWEMSTTIDPNTLFRGNSLLTKMVDELMKILGLPYLHDTLKSFIERVIFESKPCEIDGSKLRDGENVETNLENLYGYVKDAVDKIVNSALVCPSGMRDVFSTLKTQAMLNYPDNTAVRYHAVTSFIFLRFFMAAILGPVLFDLRSENPEPSVQRTLTLISKGVSGLVNFVSSKTNSYTMKEEYMSPLYAKFHESTQTNIKMFIDIISSSSGSHFKDIEAPIILKEGFMIKRAQGRKKFGLKNFKKRFFRLTNQSLSYYKHKGEKQPLFEIHITDILAVERLEEESFKMKYMFQVVHTKQALYVQANNCVEEKEWLNLLMNICKSNKNRHPSYHPGAFINNHWLCCKSTDHSLSGCTPVTSGLQLTNIQTDFDSDREVEKIHSLFLDQIDKLDALQGYVDAEDIEYNEICGDQAVYHGEVGMNKVQGLGSNIEDPSSCYQTIAEIQKCVITLEQEHIQYMRSVQRKTVIGSIDTPIGDESNADLLRNMHRSSERLSRHGSRSSNASNISRRSFRGNRSRGGSFRERDKTRHEGEGVRKSLSGDVAVSSKNLAVDFRAEVKKAASYDVMATECDSVNTSQGNNSFHDQGKPDVIFAIEADRDSASENVFDSNTFAKNLTVDPPRSPKKSTGFSPSFNPEPKSARSSGHSDVEAMRAGSTNGSIISFTNHIEVTASSHNSSGVLETSLETNDAITTMSSSSNSVDGSIKRDAWKDDDQTCQGTSARADTNSYATPSSPTRANPSPHCAQPSDLLCCDSKTLEVEVLLQNHQHPANIPERPHDFAEPLQSFAQPRPATKVLLSTNSLDSSQGHEQATHIFKRQLSQPASSGHRVYHDT
uniref:Ras GTPase-activating protein n=1 Tax=Biomphalaria glabrata TaxID=6526 RepID=A0A2C9K6R3_BIOGL